MVRSDVGNAMELKTRNSGNFVASGNFMDKKICVQGLGPFSGSCVKDPSQIKSQQHIHLLTHIVYLDSRVACFGESRARLISSDKTSSKRKNLQIPHISRAFSRIKTKYSTHRAAALGFTTGYDGMMLVYERLYRPRTVR